MRNVLSTLTIGFDLDSILAATDEACISWFQEKGLVGPDVTAAEITKWDFSECLPVTHDHMRAMFRDDDFFRTIPPIPEAIALLRCLHHNGATVHIFTDRPCPEVTATWLKRFQVPYYRLEFMKGDEKPYYAEKWGMDFTLEDNPKTAPSLAQRVKGISFLRDRPYNRDVLGHPKLHRFYTYDELFRFFRL